MRFFTALPILTAALSLLSSVAAVPSAAPVPVVTNGTNELNERTFYIPSGYELCANVADDYYRGRFDFGCLCISDVPDFCRNNGISSAVGTLIQAYIYSNGELGKYPKNAQPTCDGNGGFHCGSLRRVGNKCEDTSCPANTCSSNGGCCPRGQTYHNGQCCATQGCNRSGQVCTPVYQCRKNQFKSNDICCDNAGWIGLETICCPPGQVEKDKACGCPAGKKKNPKNSNECISSCTTSGWEYSKDKCCPPGSEQSRSGGACECTDDQETLSPDGQTCVSKCGAKTTWHFYHSKCCPPGATEDAWGNCACTSDQNKLSDDKQSCVPKCGSKTTWTFHETKCCPPGADENRSRNCVCTDPRKELSDDGQSCVDKCAVPSWNHCRTKCCPPGSDEDNSGNCVCTDPQEILSTDKKSCVDRCPVAGEEYKNTKCCKKFLVQKDDQCVCPNLSDKIYGNQCVPKCDPDENYKPAMNGKPEYCEPKCDEKNGYVFSTSKYNKVGRCCKAGMTACETICCPNGQSEASPGHCCPIGATWDGHKCVAPTHVPAKKALTGRAERKAQLGFTGMESNKKNELCPVGLAACLIPGTLTNEYECLDAMNDLQSCGGCTSMGTGQDCTAIKGAKWMGCNAGQCEVYSCRAGFKRVGGNKCEAI